MNYLGFLRVEWWSYVGCVWWGVGIAGFYC